MTDLSKETSAEQLVECDMERNFNWLRGVYDSSIVTFKDVVVIDGTTDFKTHQLFPEIKVRLFKNTDWTIPPLQSLSETVQFFLFGGLIGGVFGFVFTLLFGIGFLETILVILGLGAVYFMGTASTDVTRRAVDQIVANKDRLLELVPLLDHPDVSFKQQNLRKFKLTAIHLKHGVTVNEDDLFSLGLSVISAYQQINGDAIEIEFRNAFHNKESI